MIETLVSMNDKLAQANITANENQKELCYKQCKPSYSGAKNAKYP